MGRPRILKKKKVGKMKAKHAKQAAARKATKVRKEDRPTFRKREDYLTEDSDENSES